LKTDYTNSKASSTSTSQASRATRDPHHPSPSPLTTNT